MTTSTSRRALCLALAAGGAGLSLADVAAAGGDEGPCSELIGHKVRVLGPNSPMTMDYNPDRVNIFHDDDYVITDISFG